MNIQLARGEAVPVRNGAGQTVYAHQRRSGLAIVEAFGDASISIR